MCVLGVWLCFSFSHHVKTKRTKLSVQNLCCEPHIIKKHNLNVSQPPSSTEVNSPDGWLLGTFYFQIIRLFLHLKFGEHQRDGVARICQYGPLTFPAAAQPSGSTTSGRASGVTIGEIEAGDEPAGAPQGATTRVLSCQSPRQKNMVGESRYI